MNSGGKLAVVERFSLSRLSESLKFYAQVFLVLLIQNDLNQSTMHCEHPGQVCSFLLQENFYGWF